MYFFLSFSIIRTLNSFDEVILDIQHIIVHNKIQVLTSIMKCVLHQKETNVLLQKETKSIERQPKYDIISNKVLNVIVTITEIFKVQQEND